MYSKCVRKWEYVNARRIHVQQEALAPPAAAHGGRGVGVPEPAVELRAPRADVRRPRRFRARRTVRMRTWWCIINTHINKLNVQYCTLHVHVQYMPLSYTSAVVFSSVISLTPCWCRELNSLLFYLICILISRRTNKLKDLDGAVLKYYCSFHHLQSRCGKKLLIKK